MDNGSMDEKNECGPKKMSVDKFECVECECECGLWTVDC